jgi:hypothetical protein
LNSGDLAGALTGVIFFLSIAAVVILRGPVGKALARRIEGGAGVADDRVRQLEARIQELEASQGRVAELEERMDFAERLLTHGAPDARAPLSSALEEPR